MQLVSLDSPAALDVLTVGAKAARLARARQAGLPALPGFAVSAASARDVVRRALAGLEQGGTGRARMAAMSAPVDARDGSKLRAAATQLGNRVVVRSSSPLEGDGRWSGAFASYVDVGVDEVPLAIHGCWASMFSVSALERAEAMGAPIADATMAVLVQPLLVPDSGGLAVLHGDGSVEIFAVAGSPAPLLSGWEPGHQAVVAADGSLAGPAVAAVGATTVAAAAALAVEVGERIGDDVIEWAAADGVIHLLQSRSRGSSAAEPALSSPRLDTDQTTALRLCRGVARFQGQIGERLVLPWVFACPVIPAAFPLSGSMASLLHDAEALASELTAMAWAQPPDRAAAEAASVIAALRGPEPTRAIDRLQRLRVVDVPSATRLIGLLLGVGHHLAVRGRLESADEIWCATESVLVDADAPSTPRASAQPVRASAGRWEPFLFAAATSAGSAIRGTPAVGGFAIGRATSLAGTAERRLAARHVLVADQPLPSLAPNLWQAAGLVIRHGSPGAHLVEVARSLRVPTVVNCELPLGVGSGSWLAAIDGEQGTVRLVPLDGRPV